MKKLGILVVSLSLIGLITTISMNAFAQSDVYEIDSISKSTVVVKEIMVPDLIGRGLDESIAILKDVGLGYNIDKTYLKTPKKGVINQYPLSKTYIRDDVKVNLYIEEKRTKEQVKWLQESLKIAGFYTSMDGQYGDGTASKLNEFKKSEASLLNDYLFNTSVESLLLDIRQKKLAPNFATKMVLVDKEYYIPSEFKPEKIVVASVKSFKDINISSEIKEPLEKMFADAKKAGFELYLLSGYRSYDYQEMLFSRKVKAVGFDKAQRVVAVPGESEHQTGLAVDVSCKSIQYGLNNSLENTKEFEWLIDNCYKYGFILRYPKGKSDITGYIYEPWHYRYIGDTKIAKYIMDNNITFEEYIVESEKSKLKNENEKKSGLENDSNEENTNDNDVTVIK